MSDKSIFEYVVPPFVLGVWILIATFIIMMMISFIAFAKNATADPNDFWWTASSFTLLYTVIGSVMSIPHDNQNRYFIQAMITYFVVAGIGAGMAYLFCGVNMDTVGSYKWLYLVFFISFIIFLIVARSSRRLIMMAMRDDRKLRGED